MFPHEFDNGVFEILKSMKEQMKWVFKEEENTVYNQKNKIFTYTFELVDLGIQVQDCVKHTKPRWVLYCQSACPCSMKYKYKTY